MDDAAALQRHYASPHFMACQPRWNLAGRTIVVLGDVYFTDCAMRTICMDTARGVRFYGRAGASALTGTAWGELFAISFYPEDHASIVATVTAIRDSGWADSIRGWQLYRQLNRLPLHTHTFAANDRFVEINDFTDDFDFPADYDTWTANWQRQRRQCH